ncbi:leucine-rich repeat-containing protein 1 isoform X2 [Parasteatoda tepidariorum]|uniref:leucine-rich repeat-containing protein 1 isoform X2 n=1 Tax=Parasteatoda tepidariorum TaxID=114398 RepID=UPI0039BCB5A2
MEETANFSSQELCQVPDLQFSSTTKLILDYNDITTLPAAFCKKLPRLVFLSVNGNLLKELPSDIGHYFTNLTELHARENLLRDIPKSLCYLSKLTKLHLTGNRISDTLPNEFSFLFHLTELVLDENELTHLPSDFGKLESLTHLDVSNNFLCQLPESFGMLKSLKELNLSNNRLKALPDSFENLPSLEIVDLTDNEVRFFPNDSKSALSMVKLFMNENCLTGLPNWISESRNLRELSVSANDLLEVPPYLGTNNHLLEQIDLSGNSIHTLPESVGHLKELRFLDMGSALDELERNRFIANGNNLKHLPDSFTCLENLIKLELDENQLCELPTDFGSLLGLTYLDICHNDLKKLPDSFSLLKNLKICLLSMNYLTELPQNFGMLCSLEDLKLDHNMLTELPESFSNLVTLTSLDLYNNNLKEIPKGVTCLKQLKQLDLRENDFGLSFEEIPEIIYEPTYLKRKPELSENWRGRKRSDISQDSWVESKADTEDESKLNDNVVYSALTSSSSLWRKHGQSDVRSSAKLEKDDSMMNASINSTANEDFWDKSDESVTGSSCSDNSGKFLELSDWESDDSANYMPSSNLKKNSKKTFPPL